jgi:hypothetical protein
MRQLLIALSLLLATATLAAPGDANSKTSVSFSWDSAPAGEIVDGFILYSRTNLTIGNWVAMPHAIPGSVTNTAVPVTLFAGWPTYKGPWFFCMTATNFWGESDFSDTATAPALPRAGSGLKLTKAQ